MLASATGTPYDVFIYKGKTEKSNDDPLGTREVKSASEVCKEPKKHHVFFDHFFTSYKLVNELNTIGFSATGTMRENQSLKCPVMNVAEVMKKRTWFLWLQIVWKHFSSNVER